MNSISDCKGVYYSADGKILLKCKNDELSEYTVKEGTEEICRFAFAECKSLTRVVIPETVLKIGDRAFCYCNNLESVSLPQSLESVEFLAFDNCEELEYTSYGYALYLGNKENPYLMLASAIEEKTYSCVIHDHCKIIGGGAFGICSKYLEMVIIPDSVKAIGVAAFAGCTSLTSIDIPDSVVDIGSEAFLCCYNLRSVTIGKSVVNIGSDAFAATGLASVNIPKLVKSFGREAI